MILIVDMNWKRNSLAFNEFVAPIFSVVEPFEACEIKHFSELEQSGLNIYSKIIFSGTALKDHATLSQLDKFNWIKNCNNPMLGICAGIQTISLVFGEPLRACLQIGMTEIHTLKANQLFENDFNAYCLHNYTVQSSQTFEVLAKSAKCVQAVKHRQKNIYGVLFHPEVRNADILKRFLVHCFL
jgi:GMP synthase-like glutamine amidotransferase